MTRGAATAEDDDGRGCRANYVVNGARRRGCTAGVWLGAMVAVTFATAITAAAPSPLPVIVQSTPGRFEITAHDASLGYMTAAAGEEGWRLLAAPLGLPDVFSSPVLVRTAPAEGVDALPFRVTVEAGGIVSVRLRSDAVTQPVLRRALVQGLLMRLAVAHHGGSERLTCPWWLEQACVGWWRIRADPAQFDALQQETAALKPPAIDALLNAPGGAGEPRAFAAAAVWLLTFLQAESGPTREWPAFLQRVLVGEPPDAALAESYPGRFTSPEERELWWQTGYHHARRVRAIPTLEAAESRAQLAVLARFVFVASADRDADRIVALRDVMAGASERVVAAELTRRATELTKLIPLLHPFYRNAGLSLRDVLGARAVNAERREALAAAFERDWRDATELEAATSTALGRLERAVSPR